MCMGLLCNIYQPCHLTDITVAAISWWVCWPEKDQSRFSVACCEFWAVGSGVGVDMGQWWCRRLLCGLQFLESSICCVGFALASALSLVCCFYPVSAVYRIDWCCIVCLVS